MKKSFYFALAATVGLFASCSSDDLSADAPQQPGIEVNDGQAAQISIKVDSPNATTRGTGSVQGTTWGGQTFNLFMFDKGSFKPSQYVPSVGQAAVDIYNDAEMTTEAGSKIANQVINDVIQYQYFPSTGRFDFWGYRIDDAWVDDAGKAGWEDGADATKKVIEGLAAYTAGATTYTWGEPTATEQAGAVDKTGVDGWAPAANTEGVKNTWYKYKDGDDTKYVQCTAVNAASGSYTDDATVTQVTVPFKINGSQDLMVAETKTAKAAEDLAAVPGVNPEDAASYIYSAYAARRNVNPEMTFKHQLVRLQFQVKAATRDVSTQATPKIAVGTENANGDKYYAGFKVNKVEVWSKSTGKLIVAYKGNTAPESRIVWDDGQDWVARDANDDWLTTTTLTPFELKSRQTDIEKADIIMKEVGLNAAGSVSPDNGYEYNGSTNAVVPANLGNHPCYLVGTKNPETGEPTTEATTFTAARALQTPPASVFIAFVKTGTHDGTATKWDKAIVTSDPSKPLKDLEAVIPVWKNYAPATGGNLGWEAWESHVTKYTWKAEADIQGGISDNEKQGATDINEVPGDNTVGTLNKVVKYTDALANVTYYKLTKIDYDTDLATAYTGANVTNPVDDHADAPAGGDGTIVYTEANNVKSYYIYHAVGATAENPGQAEATPIGESMLVAPADDNGYLVRFSYTRCKMINANNFVDMPGEAIINVKTKAGAQFSASKYYTVTAVLYSDGEMKFEGGDIEDQTSGNGDLDDNGQGYGAES